MTPALLAIFGLTALVLLATVLAATPTYTARTTPSGEKLKDGFVAKFSFGADPNVELWEIGVKPPGIDGGEPIPQSTMWNSAWRTFAPRQLKTLKTSTFRFAYDPLMYDAISALANVVTNCGVLFSNGGKLAFWGYLRDIELDELQEGVRPEGTATIEPTNMDPSDDSEAGPDYIPPSGT